MFVLSILLVGDLSILGLDIRNFFSNLKFEVDLINFTHPDNFFKFKEFTNIDFRDFHEITISVLNIEPEIMIFIPPYGSFDLADKNHDFANISNEEVIEHFIIIIEQFSTHFILLSSDLVSCVDKISTYAGISLKKGELILERYQKSSIIRIGPVINSSPFGYLSWLNSVEFLKELDVKIIEINDLLDHIYNITRNLEFGFKPIQLQRITNTKLKSNYHSSNIPKYLGTKNRHIRPDC